MRLFDPMCERCLDWVIDSVVLNEVLTIQLSRWPWDFGAFARREARCTYSFADVQSFACVDGPCLANYWDTGDFQPLLQELPYDGVSTHIDDHKVLEDYRDAGFRRFRFTAGDDSIEVLTRGERSVTCLYQPVPWRT